MEVELGALEEGRRYESSAPSSSRGASFQHRPTDAQATDSDEGRSATKTQIYVPNQRNRYQFPTRRIELVHSNVLSIDYPVPSPIRNSVQSKYRQDSINYPDEFTHMRYTAATCDPDEYTLRNGYNIRPAMFNRHTELFIGVTYVSENKVSFSRTYHSIMQNIREITSMKSEFWTKGGPAWQKIVVCFLFDGIDPCDKDVLDVLATIGLYQDGIMKKSVDGKDTVAHIFEYTTQLSIDSKHQLSRPVDNNPLSFPPVQMILCFKQLNARKINSHRWFFTAFGRILNPEICALIDVGTALSPKALMHMWTAFYNDSHLGGACGEVSPILGHFWTKLLNPLIAAQLFEYKVSSGLDKPMESFCGYLTVLPGAFSAYRYRAIMGRPLEQYFCGDPTLSAKLGYRGIDKMGLIQKNYFLAEDRILTFELVNKAGSRWHTAYFPEVRAETDVPEDAVDFITQRRRWLNGAFASTFYSILYFRRIYKSNHSYLRKFILHLQLVYNAVSFILAWFNLAAFLIGLFVVTDLTGDPPSDAPVKPFPFGEATPYVNAALQTTYLIVVVYQFILALGNRPKSQLTAYISSFVIFGFIQMYFVVNVIYLLVVIIVANLNTSNGDSYAYISTFYTQVGTWTVWVTCASVFGSYYLAAFLNLDPLYMFVAYPQYLFVLASYTNIINVYAFSNVHDTSWGSKVEDTRVTELPSARLSKSTQGKTVAEESDRPMNSLNVEFEVTVRRALTPYSLPQKEDQISLEDSFKAFRTKLIAAYIFSNVMLCVLVMNDSFDRLKFLGDSKQHKIWFFRIWMWATSGCFAFRFVGFLLNKIKNSLRLWFLRR